MTASIIVAYRPSDQRRIDIFNWLQAKRKLDYKDLEIVVSDSTQESFNLSEARNRGVSQSSGDVVAIFDADAYVPAAQIREAIEIAGAHPGQWVIPYVKFHEFSEESTVHQLSLPPSETVYARYGSEINPSAKHSSQSISCAIVMSRQLYYEVGGYDERFGLHKAWDNYEDKPMIQCLLTVSGWLNYIRLSGYCAHFKHPTTHYAIGPLLERYSAAYGNVEAMQQLIDEHSNWPH